MQDGKRCLLVVDDEEDFRFLLRRHFKKRGYTVLEAADGVEALEIFEPNQAMIDLVITDIRMPRMDGEQLIQALRRLSSLLPIVGVTGQADLQGKLAFLDTGAYYYLDKPVEHWAIVERLVDNAIRLHHHEEQLERKRRKEREIARLLRAYILEGPITASSTSASSTNASSTYSLSLDIAIEPVEIAQPSGDYVEWFERGDGEVIFYVADASGHDDLVASFTACLSNMVLHRCHHGARPGVDEIILHIDRALDRLRSAGALGMARYLTFFIGCIDLASGDLTYVNAGHPDAFLLRPSDGEIEVHPLPSTCQPVGHISLFNRPVEVGRHHLAPGDLLFVYTDGASEMLETGNDTRSGQNQLLDVVKPLVHEPSARIVEAVHNYLEGVVGDAGFEDDTTLLAVRVLG